jgi:hypothetical protein
MSIRQLIDEDYDFEALLSSFDDPLAKKIDWTTLVKSGREFRSHQLMVTKECISFVVTQKITYLAYMLGACSLVSLAYFISNGLDHIIELALPLILGTVSVLLKFYYNEFAFDKKSGVLWYSRRRNLRQLRKDDRKKLIRLEHLYAIQLLEEIIPQSKGRYEYSYELNVVFKDGTRKNITSQKNRTEIEDFAVKLSDFLEIPIWSAI